MALLLLVVFTLFRSVVWASAQPAWFAPDEDYHFLYTEHVAVEHSLPALGKPFYTSEFFGANQEVAKEAAYALGPRTQYTGAPHARVKVMQGYPRSLRYATGGPPRPVLHPPLYYVGSTAIDVALDGKAAVTRLTVMRYWSAALGALGVFLAWLLAAQVLRAVWQQLAAAALVATQPIVAFSASTLTNDVAVLAGLTATMAWCAFLLRGPPRARQGIGLGLVAGLAFLTKATSLSLVIIIALTLLLVWRTHPGTGREVLRLAGWAAGVAAVIAGWWYVYVLVKTHTPLGERGSLLPSAAYARIHGRPFFPGVFDVGALWISHVYRGYWFDYLQYEVRTRDAWYYLPVLTGALVTAVAAWAAVAGRRLLLVPARPAVRQGLILLVLIAILFVPPFSLDVRRGLAGSFFVTEQGRFLTAGYPAVAVLAILAVGRLGRIRRWLSPAAAGLLVALSFVAYWHTWVVWCLERFYGPVGGHWVRAFRHASFDKPEWVGPGWFITLIVAACAAFVAAGAITVVRSYRGAAAEGA